LPNLPLGFNGKVITTRPTACDSTNLPLGTSYPPDALTDMVLHAIFDEISNGTFTEGDFQSFLSKRGVTDIFIVFVAQPTCDRFSGRIRIVIEIGNRSVAEYQVDITLTLAARFSISETMINTVLQPEQSAAGASGRKRGVDGGNKSYMVTSQITSPASINPIPPANKVLSSGYLVTPIWLVTLLSFLFLRR